METMTNERHFSKYIVDFFHAGRNGAAPKDSLRLKVDNDSDAIAQANWLSRHTYCHHFQVRTVIGGVHSVIYRSSAARAPAA